MKRWKWAGGLTALALVWLGSTARADRVPTVRAPSPPATTGTKPNIFVPYTTDGNSTIIGTNRVEPRIYFSPNQEDRQNPGAKPVFNLPFYGAVQSFGDRSNGAVPRPPGPPLGARQR